jgi:hypothetical protein
MHVSEYVINKINYTAKFNGSGKLIAVGSDSPDIVIIDPNIGASSQRLTG